MNARHASMIRDTKDYLRVTASLVGIVRETKLCSCRGQLNMMLNAMSSAEAAFDEVTKRGYNHELARSIWNNLWVIFDHLYTAHRDALVQSGCTSEIGREFVRKGNFHQVLSPERCQILMNLL
eukprot:TRINITY_DN106688_c0_g1_i1.p1 TRINITY_DN106688_c0_g1~~TRINITY_DN106688_c0_g1_i1.p1  ORF type:complete len:123 (+),score=18.62 TRINITY_DN106688_c0_g1_i1:88-456(+)